MTSGVAALVDSASYAPSTRRGGLEPTAELRAQVARWREMGASWQAIGRMLGGYYANDVRGLFDPDYLRGPLPGAVARPDPPPPEAKPAPGPRPLQQRYGPRGDLGGMAMHILITIGPSGQRTPLEIAGALSFTTAGGVSSRLNWLGAHGWVEKFPGRRGAWRLTAKGAEKVRAAKGVTS